MATMSKQARRKRSAQRKKQQDYWIVGVAAIFVALIALVVVVNILNRRPVGDEQVLSTQGNTHIEENTVSPIAYNSTPPTSGPHYGNLMPWNIYSEPQRYERVVHNLEDGGVAVYYQCDAGCPELVEQLTQVVSPYLSAGRHVLLAPNDPTWRIGNSQPLHQDMGNRIALTAWQRLDKFDEFDAERVKAFIDRYEGIDHHQQGS